jgi:hypothetical protein
MTELLAWTVACWGVFLAACAFFRASLGRRWKLAVWFSVVPAFLIALVLVFLAPPVGGYDPVAARFWISRAASENEAATKEELLRRVAFASPDHGWFVASEAIGSVDDASQRCRLRTMLANLPGIRNRERLGKEARDECNAAISPAKSG